nr:TetR family transcriptional regulator [Arthrobacter sp. StoSoilB13]
MRESQRTAILEAGLRVAGGATGAAITLEGVAIEAGVTKPGLMYHFPNREALMVALIEHAALQVKRRMTDLLGTSAEAASANARYRAYVLVTAEGHNMRAEWALWFQSAYRPELQSAWTKHLGPWLSLPNEISDATKAKLLTARLASDGLWAARASGVLAPDERAQTLIVSNLLNLTVEDAQP